jgi:methyl-accepting chemotaxis protein
MIACTHFAALLELWCNFLGCAGPGGGRVFRWVRVGDLRTAVNGVLLSADDHFLAVDEAGRAAAARNLDTDRAEVTAAAGKYEAFPVAADERTAYASFTTAWHQYLNLLTGQLLPAGTRGDMTTVERLRRVEGGTLVDAVTAAMDTLAARTVSASERQDSASESTYRSTRTIVVVLLVASALLSVAIAVAIAQLIAGPLAACVRTLSRIGDGDLTARVEVRSRDEIGLLAGTLNSTAATMAGTETAAAQLSRTSMRTAESRASSAGSASASSSRRTVSSTARYLRPARRSASLRKRMISGNSLSAPASKSPVV